MEPRLPGIQKRAVRQANISRMPTDDSMPRPRPLGSFIRWALPYSLLTVVVSLLGALVAGELAPPGHTTYVASAVVVATKTNIPLENLGSTTQAAFGTDTVLRPVVTQLGLHITPHALVSSGQLTASPIPGPG